MSTILSNSKKFIFFHNYKVAGTSLSRVLSKYEPHYLVRTALRKAGIKRYFPALANFPQHANALEVQALVPKQVFDDYYKFTLVRNPWDWQVSLYHYTRQTRKHFQHSLIKNYTFEEYIEWRVHHDLHLQKSFITDENGKVLVDFIGKMENIDSDFATVCQKLGIEMQLPHHNKSKHDSYKKYYSDETYQLVKDAFAEDIIMFDYEF